MRSLHPILQPHVHSPPFYICVCFTHFYYCVFNPHRSTDRTVHSTPLHSGQLRVHSTSFYSFVFIPHHAIAVSYVFIPRHSRAVCIPHHYVVASYVFIPRHSAAASYVFIPRHSTAMPPSAYFYTSIQVRVAKGFCPPAKKNRMNILRKGDDGQKKTSKSVTAERLGSTILH